MTDDAVDHFWLSFAADDRHLGCCVVPAVSAQDAIREAWERGCNPGGAVLAFGFRRADEEFGKLPVGKLMSVNELRERGVETTSTLELDSKSSSRGLH